MLSHRARAMFALAAVVVQLAAPPSRAETAGDQKAIAPGYWSYTASTILPGASVGRQCVRPDQIDEFLSGPHNRHYHCTYPSKDVSGGRASFNGVCVGKHDERYRIIVAGTYSQTHFNLRGRIQGRILGLPLSLPISIDAQWIAQDCPLGAK